MSALEMQMSLFSDNSPDGLLRQDMSLLYASHEKVRKGLFAKHDAHRKDVVKELSKIHERLERIEAMLNIQKESNEKVCVDLPLLECCC